MPILLPRHISMADAVADDLGIPSDRVALIGSQLICGAGNDEDYIVYLEGFLDNPDLLNDKGYRPDIDGPIYPDEFASYRKGVVNLIVTNSKSFFRSEIAIAWTLKYMHDNPDLDLSKRENRVAAHQPGRNMAKGLLEDIDMSEVLGKDA